MVNLQKIDDSSVKFVFTDSDHYLVGNGEIVVPINSLSLVIDDSEMVTFKKSATGDPFISFRADNSNLGTKEAIEQFYKENMVGAGGLSEEEVQDMIDSATSGIPSSQVVEQLRTDVNTLSGNTYNKPQIDGFLNNATTMLTTISGAVDTHEADIADLWYTIDEKEEVIASALTEVRQDVADIDAKEEVIASALTEVRQNKQDKLQYYSENTEDGTAMINVESELPILTMSTSAADGTNDLIELDRRVILNDNKDDGSGNTSDASIIIDNGEISFDVTKQENGETNHTYMLVNPTSVTINDERVLTESDGAYYISFATIATTGIRDEDWDGIVAAIDAHRPIYAGYPRNDGGILYYGVECMNKNVTNTEIVMTASDDSQHYFYTFTKNGSNDYSYTVSTKPYVTDAEKNTWNAKADLSAVTTVSNDLNTLSGAVIDNEYTVSQSLNDLNTRKLDASAYTPTDLSQYWTSAQTQSAIDDVKAYYIDFGVLTTQGIHDADWDGMVNAINAHRPIYAGLGGEYYVSECLAQSGNQIILTASNHLAHFSYTFTKNGSENYSFTSETRPYTTTQEKAAWTSGATNASTALTNLGGLKLVKISQADYDVLATRDENTLYIIPDADGGGSDWEQ